MKQLILFTLLVLLAIVANAQCAYETNVPQEYYRERYQPINADLNNPHTMFNKRTTGWVLDTALKNIRNNIKSQIKDRNAFGFALLYKTIFVSASVAEPGKCIENQGDCPHPVWVKNNALVGLIGLKYDTINGKDTFITLTSTEKEYYNWRANQGLENLNPAVPNKQTSVAHVGFNLLYYLQAYDMLKTSDYLLPGDGDRNGGDCSSRNKLREYSRNYYAESNKVINSRIGMKKNHGIICASVLGVAAIVLWDAGIESKVSNFLLGWLNGSGSKWPRPKYNPNKWMARCLGTGGGLVGLGGEDGLEDNFFSGDHMWPYENVPQTNSEGTSGYAEGPNYAQYAFSAFLPFVRAEANFRTEIGGPIMEDTRYQNIFNWFFNIQTYNEILPTYDNSSVGGANNLGLLGDTRWPSGIAGIGIAQYGDFLLANGAAPNASIPLAHPKLKETYLNTESGNGVLRNVDANNNTHYLMLLAEKGTAIDRTANIADGSHEDDDFGSISLFLNADQLAIDPPYMGWGTHANTNKIYHHNVVSVNNDDVTLLPAMVSLTHSVNGVNLNAGLMGFNEDLSFHDSYHSNRNIKVYKTLGRVYYAMHDLCISANETEGFLLRLNGNGNSNEGSFVQTDQSNNSTSVSQGRIFKWTHPCTNLGWGSALLAHSATIRPGSNTFFANYTGSDYIHGSGAKIENKGDNAYITRAKGFKTKYFPNAVGGFSNEGPSDRPYGEHNRMLITQESTKAALFQTILLPYHCSNDSIPLFSRIETDSNVTTIMQFRYPLDTVIQIPYLAKQLPATVPDTILDIHFARERRDTSTVNIPNTNETLFVHAQNAYLSIGSFQLLRPGSCSPSFVRFKKAELVNGVQLAVNDTNYIFSDNTPVDIFYEHTSKYTYKGEIDATSGATVTLRLPDLFGGYLMHCLSGNDVITSTHNPYASADSFQLITINFPAGNTKFTIELADPCQADCYFPPTNLPIDTISYFSTGTKEVLGHDLDIIQPSGQLHITNGSKMSICPDFVFTNKDSLLLYATETEEVYPYQNPMDGASTISTPVRNRIASKHSMIIVNDKAALVLDSGSFTHVGDNSTILVLKGGTLLIRKHAVVEIGGNEATGINSFGEIIAEEGAFVCIEDSSDTYFFADTPTVDTADNNVFYVNLNPYLPTVAGTNPLGARGRFVPLQDGETPQFGFEGMYANSNCITFCDLKTYRPLHGINNHNFGWCNFSEPVAKPLIPNLLCGYQPILIKQHHVLNETSYLLELYNSSELIYTKQSNTDTLTLTTQYLPPLVNDDSYTIKLFVQNDCNEKDTFIQTITVAPKPVAVLNTDTLGCEGFGTVIADGSASTNVTTPIKHLWHVQRLTTEVIDGNTYAIPDDYTMEWKNDTATTVNSNFTFPNFKWIGGYSYVVGLTIIGACNDSMVIDTVHIPHGVTVTSSGLKSVSNNIGVYGIELQGNVIAYDSFAWQPTAWLTNHNTLTPTTTTLDSTLYIFTAYHNGCQSSDSIIVKHNEFLNLGQTTTVCPGTDVLIGNKLDASYIISVLALMDDLATNTHYYDELVSNEGSCSYYKHNLSKIIYENNYQFLGSLSGLSAPIHSFLQNNRTAFYADPYYPTVLSNFLSLSPSAFVSWFQTAYTNSAGYSTLHSGLQNEIDNHNNAGIILNDFENQTMGVMDNALISASTNCSNTNVLTNWYINNTYESSYDDRFLLYETLNQTTTFGKVINNGGDIEFDEVTILVDDSIFPMFNVAYQTDSTIYFTNFTQDANPATTTYYWSFGDGGSSTATHPSHTFAAFNMPYYVCLTATNLCGSYQYCDTIWVDTNSLAFFSYGKKGYSNDVPTWNQPEKPPVTQALNFKNQLGSNRPNPFTGNTQVDYELVPNYNAAKLIITNTLGQMVQSINIYNLKGTLNIDASTLNRGMYYYSLVVDGVLVSNRVMVVK